MLRIRDYKRLSGVAMQLGKQKYIAWLPLGLTLILLGYFLPWLSHSVNGLTLIGIDISEWIKFLPQVQSGELPYRDIFYLPPITLGLMLALLSVNGRGWRPWILRGAAVAVALIAFPSIDAIRFEPAGEWRLRLIMIGIVLLLAAVSQWLDKLPSSVIRGLLGLVAAIGLIVPTYFFRVVLSVVEPWLVIDFQVGLGVWLNGIGHLAVGGLVLWQGIPTNRSEG